MHRKYEAQIVPLRAWSWNQRHDLSVIGITVGVVIGLIQVPMILSGKRKTRN